MPWDNGCWHVFPHKVPWYGSKQPKKNGHSQPAQPGFWPQIVWRPRRRGGSGDGADQLGVGASHSLIFDGDGEELSKGNPIICQVAWDGWDLNGQDVIWLVVWLPSILFSQKYWECHHPNWRTHIFQRGGPITNQLCLSCFLLFVLFLLAAWVIFYIDQPDQVLI